MDYAGLGSGFVALGAGPRRLHAVGAGLAGRQVTPCQRRFAFCARLVDRQLASAV